MRLSVTHSTLYRYDYPVYLEPHMFRLRPRTNSSQRLLTFDIQIAPRPAGTTECLDQDGTLALNAWFDAPTRELSVVMGIAARFVSGYERASASGQDSYMHALGRSLLAGHRLAGIRSFSRSRGNYWTRRRSRRLRSGSRVAGGRVVFGWITVPDGGFAADGC